jgi:hypothetical protein
MNDSDWQTTPDFNYRHIDYKTKRSNSADIFNPLKYELYEQHNIFMLVRHPVDRLLSEYSFIKTRPEFMNLIKPRPKDFESYIKSKQTQNYMIGFLVGKRMYDTSFVDRDDLELVKNAIRNINIKVGIFEQYGASLSYFSKYSNLKWPKKIEIKRITLNRPKVNEISEQTRKLILENNLLDLDLYKYALDIFNDQTKKITNKKILFRGDKYNYVMKFTQRFNILETTLGNLDFIKINSQFFVDLNTHLHHTLKIKKGKDYLELWNGAFVSALKDNCNGTPLLKNIIDHALHEDPLERNIQIGNCINRCFKNTPKKPKTLQKQVAFKHKKNSTKKEKI